MSYDVTLELTDALGGKHEVFWRNYTSNMAPMWRDAGVDLAALGDAGATGAEFAGQLVPAIAALKADPTWWKSYDSANGWGKYTTALEFLEAVLDACERWPDVVVEVSC